MFPQTVAALTTARSQQSQVKAQEFLLGLHGPPLPPPADPLLKLELFAPLHSPAGSSQGKENWLCFGQAALPACLPACGQGKSTPCRCSSQR